MHCEYKHPSAGNHTDDFRVHRDTASGTQIVLDQDGGSRFTRYGVESGLRLTILF
jgi:hypothetical protein